jgi:protein tyrosine/serine phosphatase
LYPGPQVVAERLNDVVRRDRDVGGAALDHAQNGREYTSNGGNLVTIPIACGWQRVEVAEQLVCAIDQINVQGCASSTTL